LVVVGRKNGTEDAADDGLCEVEGRDGVVGAIVTKEGVVGAVVLNEGVNEFELVDGKEPEACNCFIISERLLILFFAKKTNSKMESKTFPWLQHDDPRIAEYESNPRCESLIELCGTDLFCVLHVHWTLEPNHLVWYRHLSAHVLKWSSHVECLNKTVLLRRFKKKSNQPTVQTYIRVEATTTDDRQKIQVHRSDVFKFDTSNFEPIPIAIAPREPKKIDEFVANHCTRCILEQSKRMAQKVGQVLGIKTVVTLLQIINSVVQECTQEGGMFGTPWIEDVIATKGSATVSVVVDNDEEDDQKNMYVPELQALHSRLLRMCDKWSEHTRVDSYENMTCSLQEWVNQMIHLTLREASWWSIATHGQSNVQEECDILEASRVTHSCNTFFGTIMYRLCLRVFDEIKCKSTLVSIDACFLFMSINSRPIFK